MSMTKDVLINQNSSIRKLRKILMISDIEIDFERQIKALPHYTNSQNLIQSNLAIRNSLIMNKLVLRNHFLWLICHLLHKDKELFALRNNFRETKKFLIAKFDCTRLEILSQMRSQIIVTSGNGALEFSLESLNVLSLATNSKKFQKQLFQDPVILLLGRKQILSATNSKLQNWLGVVIKKWKLPSASSKIKESITKFWSIMVEYA